MNTSYLVNIVANDFKDGSYIFDPFLLDQQQGTNGMRTNGVGANGNGNGVGVGDVVNGVKESVNGLTQGIKNVMNGHGTAEGVSINGH